MKHNGHLVVESILQEFTYGQVAGASGAMGAVGAGIGAVKGALTYERAIRKLKEKYDSETDPNKKQQIGLKLKKLISGGKSRYVAKNALVGGGIGAATVPALVAPMALSAR